MRIERNTLLASIAALALFAGAGIASAQDTPQQNQGPQGQPPAAQQMNKAPATGNTGQNARDQSMQGPAAQGENMKAHKSAQRTHITHKNAAAQQHNRRMATEHQRMRRQTTAQQRPNAQQEPNTQLNAQQAPNGPNGQQNFGERQRNGFEGLQGNAAGGNVQLSEEQRTQIRTTILNGPNVPRAQNVNFPVIAGTVVPRGSVPVMRVPPNLVRIDPQWRGFLYFVWNDELVIVNPRDMRIVAVAYV